MAQTIEMNDTVKHMYNNSENGADLNTAGFFYVIARDGEPALAGWVEENDPEWYQHLRDAHSANDRVAMGLGVPPIPFGNAYTPATGVSVDDLLKFYEVSRDGTPKTLDSIRRDDVDWFLRLRVVFIEIAIGLYEELLWAPEAARRIGIEGAATTETAAKEAEVQRRIDHMRSLSNDLKAQIAEVNPS